MPAITVGVLALQGAFYEHIQLLKKAAAAQAENQGPSAPQWEFIEVRTSRELERCDGLILPGGESTTISLVAARSELLEPLRDFVKYVSLYKHIRGDASLPLATRANGPLSLGSIVNRHGAPAPVLYYSPSLQIGQRKGARS